MNPAALQQGVLPDGCNVGVILRVLLMVNAAVALALAVRIDNWLQFSNDFAAAAVIVEPVVLASLMFVCTLRPLVQRWPSLWQTLLGCAIPALLTWLLLQAFIPMGVVASGKDLWLPVVLAALLALLLLHYFELRARAYSPALDEARMQALQARIRPHFLFNSLNAVLGVVREDPRRAEAILEDLSDLFRALLRDARQQVSVNQEVGLCRQYLAIEELRLGPRLQVRWDVDVAAEVASIPALLLQPLVENAVHHGVEQRGQPSKIEIAVHQRGDRLLLRVANPLPEGDANPVAKRERGNQMALENIRQRLMVLYDIEAQLESNRTATQFVVEVNLPYRTI
jgi:two-component system, LytTR family, sensor histidine kinase AlgZ